MSSLELPASIPTMRELHVGEQIGLSGTVFTMRPAVYEYLHHGGDLPFSAEGAMIYNTTPIGRKHGKKWSVHSIAPDHSTPLDSMIKELFVRFGVRGVIGRGELGKPSLEACRQCTSCYFHTIAGAGPLLAKHVKSVTQVHTIERLDAADAIWELEVEDFPTIVMIDSHGQSLHDMIRDVSNRRLLNLQL